MARSKQRSRRRSHSFPTVAAAEKLETRQLLTGNVSVSIQNDNLVIDGDADANEFELTFFDGDVAVRPFGETTINGSHDNFIAFPDTNVIPRNVQIRLAGGDDSVVVSRDLIVTKQIRVQGGAGNDTFGVFGATINGNLRVILGSGTDGISVRNVEVGGDLVLQGNNGRDAVGVYNVNVADEALLRTHGGDDHVVVESLNTGGLTIDSGDGNDGVAVAAANVSAAFSLVTDMGNDVVQLIDSRVQLDTFIGVGADTDGLALGQSGARNVFVGDFETNGSGGENTYQEQNNRFLGERTVLRYIDGSVNLTRVDNALNRVEDVHSAVDALFVQQAQTLVGTPINSEQSVSAFVTRESSISLVGQTTNDATVELDADGDGVFDDGVVQADEFGNYTLPVDLVAGLQEVSVRSTDAIGAEQTLDVSIHRAIGSITRFQTSLGDFHVELLDDDAPLTVANYQNYFDSDNNAVIHRSIGNFVIQGGGFQFTNGQLGAIETNPPVENEFNANNSNLRGTLSTALRGGDLDSATNQWFINLSDNTFLDNAGHTVFGRVIAGGLEVVDAIAGVTTFNLDGSTFSDTPLRDFAPFSQQLTGTLNASAGSPTITGTDTLFTQELQVGQTIQVREGDDLTGTFVVIAIVSDTELLLSDQLTQNVTEANGFLNVTLSEQHFVFANQEDILS
jgi:cyclophilin family peptidyl-prolyl cis-trans isomerase